MIDSDLFQVVQGRATVHQLELPPVVVNGKLDPLGRKLVDQALADVGRTPHRVQIFEVVGHEAADGTVRVWLYCRPGRTESNEFYVELPKGATAVVVVNPDATETAVELKNAEGVDSGSEVPQPPIVSQSKK